MVVATISLFLPLNRLVWLLRQPKFLALLEARLNYRATRMIAKMLSAKHSKGVTQRVMMNQR